MRIEIKQVAGEQTWDVYTDGKIADRLGWEEMLGVVAALTMPTERRCLNWLKTPEQRKAERDYFDSIKTRVDGKITDVEFEKVM